MNAPTRTIGLPGSTPPQQGSLPKTSKTSKTSPGLPGSERRIGLPGSQPAPTNPSTQRKTASALPQHKAVSHQPTGALPRTRPEASGSLPTPTRKTVSSGALPKTVPAFERQAPLNQEPSVAVKSVAQVPETKAPVSAVKADDTRKAPVQSRAAENRKVKKAGVKAPAKRTRNRDFKLVDRDYDILRGLIRYKILTPTHISRMVSSSRESIRKRMDILITQGFAERGPHKAILVYFPTALAARALGFDETVVGKPPTVFGYKHLLMAATFGIEMQLGENVSTLTGGMFPNMPMNIITELEIKTAEKNYSKEELWANWKSDCQALLQDQDVSGYPSLEYGLTIDDLDTYSHSAGHDEASREVFLRDVERYLGELGPYLKGIWLGRRISQDDDGQISQAHLFNTRDYDLVTTKTINNKKVTKNTERTPDLVITLPNIVHEDGTITGGSIAAEFEFHPKDMARCLIILLCLWHNPLLAGTLFVTDNPQVVNIMRKAMTILSSGPHRPFTMEQALHYFHFVPPMLLNANLDATGLLA